MRRLLYRLLYGPAAWRAMWALEVRCVAAEVDIGDALTMAGVQIRNAGYRLPDASALTQRHEAIGRVRKHFPHLPHETVVALVRIAAEGVAVEDAGG